MNTRRAALTGAALVALYTGAIAAADGITKLIAGGYAAPQLFALSSGLVIALSLLAARGQGAGLSTRSPGTMAVRAVLTVCAAIGFFQAFRLLPFADVFVFIALMPLIAAALSGPVLGERVRPATWTALLLGAGGVLCLMPAGRLSLDAGHLWALFAALTGTGSMVAARRIARIERVPLAQVFWPNLAVMLVMAAALPFVWTPMPLADLGWVAGYAVFLFAARWLSVEALRLLPAYVATPLMNLQFVWMVAIGWWGFGELPTAGTLVGVMLVVGSGMWLIFDEALPGRRMARA
ncbi:MAG: EamA/RhaT family transporter [Rhodobacteraceae bacterium]|jgi:drug/metabolite transporter (DMT)-like permease|uniref:S-adenosylmethionine uptake transporter n=1 Tax=Salipiger profundus TaxID=1229727 RepID=A0A1U7DAU6_9RHOB|nr:MULTISPECIES: DMT family transporter [Salipiger]APX25175.1 S-adenosylmethionine uptake transporter [Salipiger profundus]MAB05512.1 EamA/RhaT family transporter [Paracoccaceae bacterium]GGA15856.1 RhaT family transporter [Salipiger profundus]SFD09031.1 EamA-like transporter family protein [Salipiger profundus]